MQGLPSLWMPWIRVRPGRAFRSTCKSLSRRLRAAWSPRLALCDRDWHQQQGSGDGVSSNVRVSGVRVSNVRVRVANKAARARPSIESESDAADPEPWPDAPAQSPRSIRVIGSRLPWSVIGPGCARRVNAWRGDRAGTRSSASISRPWC